MQNWPLKPQFLKKPRFIPLRYRLIFITSLTILILFIVLAFALVIYQQKTFHKQIENRGMTIAQSLAATSAGELLNYNYLALEQLANQIAQNPDVFYVIVHDKEGRVAGYSKRADLQGKILHDAISLNAIESDTQIIQPVVRGENTSASLDVSVPVYAGDSPIRWGTVRVCLSLASVRTQIRQTLWLITINGFTTLSVGILLSIWGARRVTLPLGNLVQSTIEAAEGNLNQSLAIKTGDEVEVLANNFSTMIAKILEHRADQEKQLIEIQRLQQYTENLLTTMSDGLLSVRTDNTIATINPAALSLLEISPEHPQNGAALEEVVPPDTILYSVIQDAIKNPTTSAYQEVPVGINGHVKTVLIGFSTLLDKEDAIREIIFNLHDITALKELEARMRQNERLASLGTLAAGMAHEIRNPLSAIKTFVQLLPRKIGNERFLEKFNRTVPRETERINQLIEELLELSRVPKYNLLRTDIALLIKDALDIHVADFERCGIEQSLQFPEDLPQIQVDANQMIKAFHNLIQNAIQAMPSGGQLQITASCITKSDTQTEGAVAITFKDQGQGIRPKRLKNIFDPFFTTKDAGTGLGLAITHKVITEHGGHIKVKSREGEGTTFTVRLPIRLLQLNDDNLDESAAGIH